ncbi:helix-turn-helix transcriptional regulator [Marinobacter sp. HN1S83]|uniref:helix-turn-helix transcriptional regulator n=1 Tax=Marinobacter sp. HN1S83 TaxID=3382301 RepID=UPI00387B97B3
MHTYCRNLKSAYMYPWAKRTLFIGPLLSPVTVAYGAATLIVSLGDKLHLSDGSTHHHAMAFLLPPGKTFCIDAKNNPVAICHLDVLGQDFAGFVREYQQLSKESEFALHEEDDYRDVFSSLYRTSPDSTDAYEKVDNLLRIKLGPPPVNTLTDVRIARLVAYVKENFQENLSIENLANVAGVSVPHLVDIFKETTGITLRRFRMWHRMYESVLSVGQGEKLTDVAQHAGFFDASHFTRTFASMWGLPPSKLFSGDISAGVILPSRDHSEAPANHH